MQSTTRIDVPERLRVLVTLAQLLERFERGGGSFSADQYHSVVQHLAMELPNVEPDETFKKLLNVFPATSELYENLQYENAGLCRSPLEESMASERASKTAIALAARP